MARLAFPREYLAESPTLGLSPEDYRFIETYYDHASVMVEHFEKLGAVRFKDFDMWDAKRLATDYSENLPETRRPAGAPWPGKWRPGSRKRACPSCSSTR